MSDFISSHNRAAAFRTANGVFEVWEARTKLVKQELAAASAANDAKTIRLAACAPQMSLCFPSGATRETLGIASRCFFASFI